MIARRVLPIVVATALVAACGGGDNNQGEATGGATLVVAQLMGPQPSLDPALAGSVVTWVVARPVLETLVTVEPGGNEIIPLLATSWQPSADGRSWTFDLRKGVEFHDGTPFDAAAVCANFERWYHFTGLLQQLAGDWKQVFGNFATQEGPAPSGEGLYQSCQTPTPHQVVIHLTRPTGTLLPALAVPAFAIASPTALNQYAADKVTGNPSEPVFEGSFGREHLTGTGPFRLERWDPNDKAILQRNRDYWGEKPALERVIVRRIDDGAARRQALETGEVDGIFPLDPQDVESLRDAGFRVYEQPGLNLGFLGLNQARPPLDNIKIRQAIAYALDREKVVRAKYALGSTVAKEVVPPNLWGHANDVKAYPYDPATARRLVTESGVGQPTVELWYPAGQGTPALPDAEGIALSFKGDLETAGFTVVAKPTPSFPDWSEALESGKVQLFFGELYAYRVDPAALFDQFLSYKTALGGLDERLVGDLQGAGSEIEQDDRAPRYEEANRLVMETLPAVPFVHVKPALAYSTEVSGYRPSPIPWEGLFDVRME